MEEGSFGAAAPLGAMSSVQVTADGQYDIILRLFYRTVVFDTDAGEWVILGTLQATADDGATPILTTDSNDPACPHLASVEADIFGRDDVRIYRGSVNYPIRLLVDDPVSNPAAWII